MLALVSWTYPFRPCRIENNHVLSLKCEASILIGQIEWLLKAF